jgi:seryl-tRNA synthetase
MSPKLPAEEFKKEWGRLTVQIEQLRQEQSALEPQVAHPHEVERWVLTGEKLVLWSDLDKKIKALEEKRRKLEEDYHKTQIK